MKEGIIFDLKRFAVHDGGGLRTTLFLKGCPLRCPWCQNPEGLEEKPLVWYSPADCLRCGTCAGSCPEKALTLHAGSVEDSAGTSAAEDMKQAMSGTLTAKSLEEASVGDGGPGAEDTLRVHMNRELCTLCGECEKACPAAALSVKGRRITSREAADLLLRDRIFFGDGGGVTLSGGECLLQWEFAREVLSICKESGADTAIETCLLAPDSALQAMLDVIDHFLVDIKLLDPEKHKKILGADNRQILRNYEYLVSQGADVLVRTPLIPGYTATEENIRAIAEYVHQTSPQAKYELLNYNPLCRSKYEALELPYPVEQSRPLNQEEMDHFFRILEEEGIPHIIRE